ncbi:MAG: hypothetical protein ACFFDN_47670 [Candidatus Hodarchaeota archaeon]
MIVKLILTIENKKESDLPILYLFKAKISKYLETYGKANEIEDIINYEWKEIKKVEKKE